MQYNAASADESKSRESLFLFFILAPFHFIIVVSLLFEFLNRRGKNIG